MSATASRVDVEFLERSRRYCQALTRSQARNFYYGLKLLPEPKRSDMYALYAYMRALDDIADECDMRSAQDREKQLDHWRAMTDAALRGDVAIDGDELWPAFSEMARAYAVPARVFHDAIEGQRQDLRGERFETFDELREYCRRVAGVVGLASIYIWGFEGGEATEALAIDRGIALQLTNILRDVREDCGRGRCYLPREELEAMGLSDEGLRAGTGGARFLELMRFQIERARSFYERSAPLEQRIASDSRPTLSAMTQIYRGLLEKIAADPQCVLRRRVSLSLFTKLRIGWRAALAR